MPEAADCSGVVTTESSWEVSGVRPPDMVARSMNAHSTTNTAARILNFVLWKKSFTLGALL